VRRRLRAEIVAALDAYAGRRIVDVGCGRKPYYRFVKARVDSYIGVDRVDSLHGMDFVDVIGDAIATGLPSASADTVLMTQVLEHVEDPPAAVEEANRILEPGGHLILSTDFAWHLHEEPRDFFRFSEFGLRHIFERCQFQVVEIRPVAGTWLTIGEEIAYGLRRFGGRHLVATPFAMLAGHVSQAIGLGLDRVSFDPKLASGFVIVGRKVSPAGPQLAETAGKSP
jgi:ubiquinone/menaquinone biosynthesis C-methylase UbiE